MRKWFFKYDKETKEFIPGAVFSDAQPDFSTEIDPGQTPFPKFNQNKNIWESDIEKLATMNSLGKTNYVSPQQRQMAQMYQTFMQQQALTSARIKALEELKGGK